MIQRPTFAVARWREAIQHPSPFNVPPVIPPAWRTRESVAIHGFASVGLQEMPFDDPAWEIWGLNSGWGYCRDSSNRFRADRWFELHELHAQTPEEMIAIQQCPIPIYLTHAPPADVPNGVKFPLDALDARFGARVPYAATFCYQMAFAIHLGFRRIGLYGVELQMGTLRERTVERAAVAYWVGYARGLGIEVILPRSSGLVEHPALYGFDYNNECDIVDLYQAETAAVAAMWLRRSLSRQFLKTYGVPFQGPDLT